MADTSNSCTISVIIPTFNEAAVIGDLVRCVHDVLATTCYTYEILVIDDGSTDGTAEVVPNMARVVRHPYNKGNGAAIKTGIRASRGEIVVMMDGDGQHNPADIERLVSPIGMYDMVVGARAQGCQRWHRQVANRVYNAFSSYLTGFQIQDLTSGFRAIKRGLALQFCYLLPNKFSYPTTLTIAVIRAGFSLQYVQIHAAERVGNSKIKPLRDGTRFLLIMSKIAVLFSPLKVFLPVGLLVLAPGFLYAIYKLFVGQAWTLPIVISVSVGALIVMMGLLAEQIALLRMQHIDE